MRIPTSEPFCQISLLWSRSSLRKDPLNLLIYELFSFFGQKIRLNRMTILISEPFCQINLQWYHLCVLFFQLGPRKYPLNHLICVPLNSIINHHHMLLLPCGLFCQKIRLSRMRIPTSEPFCQISLLWSRHLCVLFFQ